VTKFIETTAFKDLQTKVYDDIAGVILSYLKEAGVPEDKLQQLSQEIHYDLFAIMTDLGKQQIPGAEIYADKMKSTLKEMVELEEKVQQLSGMEVKVKEIAALEEKLKQIPVLEEKLKGMAALKEEKDKEIAALEEQLEEIAMLKQKVRRVEELEVKINAMAGQQAKVRGMNEQEEESDADALPDLQFDDFDSILAEADELEQEAKNMDNTTTDGVLDPSKAQHILNKLKSA
jgi:virulence-associated protein VapD